MHLYEAVQNLYRMTQCDNLLNSIQKTRRSAYLPMRWYTNWVIIFYLPPKKGNQETPLTKKNVLIEKPNVGYNIWNACMMMYDV